MAATGVLIGVDPGAVRVGVAATDPAQILASPVATLAAAQGVSGVVQLVGERAAVAVVVGLPLTLRGAEGTAANRARGYAEQLAVALGGGSTSGPVAPVYLVDERFTTVTATAALRAGGHDSRSARRVVDQAAAAALLQGLLDLASARGTDAVTVLSDSMGQPVRPSEP